MTGTDLCVNKCKHSRSYLNHLVFIYYSSLHVSCIHMPSIRKLLYMYDTGICHSLSMGGVWSAGWIQSNQQTRRHSYRVTNTSVAQIQQFSPDDGHVNARNMQRRKINILNRIVHLVGFIYEDCTGMHGQQNITC